MLSSALREVREGKAISSSNKNSILAVIEALKALLPEDETEHNSIQHYRLKLREREI